MARKKFIRRNHDKYSRLGGRRKKLVWRRPVGRHSKTRERRAGYPARPEMGMKRQLGKKPVYIENMKTLKNLGKGTKIIIARVGRKLRTEIEKIAGEKGFKILNKKKAEAKTGK